MGGDLAYLMVGCRRVWNYNSLICLTFFEKGVCLRKHLYEKLWDHLGKREKLDLGSTNVLYLEQFFTSF